MMLPIISDNNNTLVYGADLIPTSAHIPLPWIMAYDVQPTITIEEKKKLYSDAVNDNWICFSSMIPISQLVQLNLTENIIKRKIR